MRTRFPLRRAIVAGVMVAASAEAQQQQGSVPPLRPRTATRAPSAPVRPVTDTYYGTTVVDPYRYMENLEDPTVVAWLKAQHDYTASRLDAIPGRAELAARIRELDQSGAPALAVPLPGETYLIRKQLPGDDDAKLYVRRGLTGADRLLVDPTRVSVAPALRGKGPNTISYFVASPDGRYVAVGIVPGGSEKDTELHIFEMATARELPDAMPRVWPEDNGPSVSWLRDSHSLIYPQLRRLPADAPQTEIMRQVRAYLHVLGTNVARDRAVFGYQVVPGIAVDPAWLAMIVTTPGSDYALGVLNLRVAPMNIFYIRRAADLGTSHTTWQRVADSADDVADMQAHGNDLYALTYKNAPRYKVLRIDARHPDLASAETVVPAGTAVVVAIYAAQDALYVTLRDGAISRLERVPYGRHPHVEEVPIPTWGSAYIGGDPRLPGVVIGALSWTQAYAIYRYDPAARRVTDTGLQPVGPYDRPSNLQDLEIKIPSYDGTLVPLSIVSPRGLKLDGTHPTLLDGYGAYGYSIPTLYEPTRLVWHERGGIYAVCHVRGGGEYGEEWHLAGKGSAKPNTWLDFIACAEYLVNHRYTSPARLAGAGAGPGGILIGRAITERPDLFGAAIDRVGLSDMVRIETSANGLVNVPEFGSTKTESGFRSLLAMSAYHHIRDRTAYPAVLLTTGVNDLRVAPWQVAKMTARLQAATTSGKPVLLRVDYGGGHGPAATEQQYQNDVADGFSFLLWQLGDPAFQPKR